MAATRGDAEKWTGEVLACGLMRRGNVPPTASRWSRIEEAAP
ncbi:hypothetical protein [Shinella granuli]|uniref:Uncharacterized protein n=1 Tax=Shinella granuli TaxID=323621 RepID=A0A4V2RIX5_SHIGR|nr:hypothetical protein [Shinella granuli]TCN45960.1 hypothetical protein EV665_10547 [Shinella granuli]